MLRVVVAGTISALALTLTGCGNSVSQDTQNSARPGSEIAWNRSAISQLRHAIEGRAAHGLDHLPFDLPESSSGEEDGKRLTRAALRYAGALAHGAADPAKLFPVYTVPRPDIDLKKGLAEAIATGNVEQWLDSLAPQIDSYRKLSAAYLDLRERDTGATAAIPHADVDLKPGESDPRVPAIARQLVASDYLSHDQAGGDRYDEPKVEAVRRMQADYGIKPDGVIGPAALEILNLSDLDRARAIAVAMERMRWLERQAPATRIDVNLASARLTYWRDGKIADTRKVVVGDPDTETPQLGSPIYRLVANPTWTVPRSIERKEIAGKGGGYLRRHNMAWEDGWIVQQPGPDNSLGLVKFDMQNDHQIYLHDTPAKQLFGEVQRQRSHGCVRVEDALGFAEMLAQDSGVGEEWRRARETGKESFVALPDKLPVRLFYQTVLFDEAGAPVVRADPYGWNDRVAHALGFPTHESRRLKARTGDVAP